MKFQPAVEILEAGDGLSLFERPPFVRKLI
jgi:hypothetical protein